MVTGRSDSLWQKIFRAYQAKEYKPGHHRKIDSESQTTDLSTYIGATLRKKQFSEIPRLYSRESSWTDRLNPVVSLNLTA
jgi:hypothetical protein